MDKSRYKRPPTDINEALSSMLWTPYDQTASDSLSDDEREREKRKLNRYSNPLPSSLNWWNSHVDSPSTLRYSYPYHGSCVPSTSSSSGQTQINTPTTTMVHSFTDDFYQYQHHQSAAAVKQHHNYTTNCQSTHKYYKSQPSLPHINIINNNNNNNSTFDVSSGSVMANGIIDTHLVSSSTTSPIINALPMHFNFNHQRTNVRTLSSSTWQNNKAGNVAYVHNIVQHSSKTSSMNVMVGAVATKQISCNRNSKENATYSCPREDVVEYRLSCALNNRSKCRAMNGAEEFNNLNNNSTNSTATMVQIDNDASIRDLSDYSNPQMPSTSSSHVQSQQFLIPVSLTNNVATLSSRTIDSDALRCNNNNNNKDSVVDVNRMSVVECNQNIVEDAIITSAIDLASSSSTHGTPSKAKYSNDIVTVREKRRRNRRDRRLARTRALSGGSTSEILPDILNNPRPPPYSSLPPSLEPAQQIPSIISTVPVEDTRYTFSLPLVRRSTSDRSGKDCCGQWFNGPPLRFLVALVALGGVACTLGGATLGSIALAGSPTSHLTAGLLMTGVGIVLVTISGIAWRMTTSEAHQCTGRCGRRQCSRGNSSFGLLYPEFQHRPPPPSYQASMQEHRLRIMMLDRERQAGSTTSSSTRASPPPTYHSNAGTLLRPAIHFQRQSHSNNVQVEIPIDNEINPCNSSAITTSSLGYSQHQSPTSSQTITTIASINRPDDNSALSQPSLIKLNSYRHASDEDEHDDIVGIHIALNGNICSRTSRDSSSSSRCTSSSDRHTICIKDSDDHHDTDIRECKNVNISTELNKALMSTPHLSSTLPRNVHTARASFLLHDRCELGVR